MQFRATPTALAGLCLLACLPSQSASAQQPDLPAGWFVANPAWTLVENVVPTADGSQLITTSGRDKRILFINGAKPGTPHLRTEAFISDSIVSMEYMLRADTRAGLYLHAGYRIQLDGDKAGTLGVMVDAEGKPSPSGIVPPLHPVASQPGTWRDDEAVRGHVERVDDRSSAVPTMCSGRRSHHERGTCVRPL